MPILTTKLYTPSLQPKFVQRPHLIERMNENAHKKMTLVSAPAGFGKTSLISEWIAECMLPATWVSLDEWDNDPTRFFTYLLTSLQKLKKHVGEGLFDMLQSPQTTPSEMFLTSLLNEITTIEDPFVLVLDDYHMIDSKQVNNALSFLIDHQPPQMHVVIITREDPGLSLTRLRAQAQMTEVRASDLRFSSNEVKQFLDIVIGVELTNEEVAALASRTEGWVTGLQLAGISMQGHKDTKRFIETFTGSHHFILDYLLEEVLQQQPETIQSFLLTTSILDRFNGPLCEAVLRDDAIPVQETLRYLERSNLFIVPLDTERNWYRYHHLFGELLKQRLNASGKQVTHLHKRASEWYEQNGLELEAFYHATLANDLERSERLAEGNSLLFRGAVTPVINWLSSLPEAILNQRPSLWVMYAYALMIAGQNSSVEQKLHSAEMALEGEPLNEKNRDVVGRMASVRAIAAASQYQTDQVITESSRALEYLDENNLYVRTVITWTLGYAYRMQGEALKARKSFQEAISTSQASGNDFVQMLAITGLGQTQEEANELYLAEESYKQVLHLAGEPPKATACEAYLGLARLHYEWNDLDAAESYVKKGVNLARQIEGVDSFVACEILLARIQLAKGSPEEAASILNDALRSARKHDFTYQLPKIFELKIMIIIHNGNLQEAERLAQAEKLLMSEARVYQAKGHSSKALQLLEEAAFQIETEPLRVKVLQAVLLYECEKKEQAIQVLHQALILAEPFGGIRTFTDEGPSMQRLLTEASAQGVMPNYVEKILDTFSVGKMFTHPTTSSKTLVEPLSERELEILTLIDYGLSNKQIGERLYLALSTVKGHNRNIFDKLGVKRRTEAVARARELKILS
ncbi:LuxR C-terminal-related transcriptional regulator [Halobacillus litoralis]|uniref:LuxR C-terminal-related transcriptional regulator n=1 Tax=Halobacillus litoralis TaxID=45668 RepID=UPI0029700888|nr:LuxR C-terminal-related transcriptional regulator [Halobacillus litoralis]